MVILASLFRSRGFGSFKYQAFANNTNKLFNVPPYQTLTHIFTVSVKKGRQNRYVFKDRLILIRALNDSLSVDQGVSWWSSG